MTSLFKAFFLPCSVFLLAGLVFSPNLRAQGFSTGNKFFATPIEGHVIAFCQRAPGRPGSGPSSYQYFCRDEILDPAEMDYFVGPASVEADTLQIRAIYEEGSSKMKSYSYDSEKHRSKKRINLWVASLFQRPLLKLGVNQIEYVLSKSDQVVSEGRTLVQVEKMPLRTCPYSSITIYDPNECSNQLSVCRRYFQHFNYCQERGF